MRKLPFLTLLLLLPFALPLHAQNNDSGADAGGRDQSYFTYDDGGTIVRQGEDGREVDARINYPLFPGDEVLTSRRGRSEIRLSDGNIVGLDRSTDVHFKSILASYDGDGSQTIAELRYGHVVIQRTEDGEQPLRVDTDSASYVATKEAIYAVDCGGRGKDRVTVFEGSVEVRTPARSTRINAGDQGSIDEQGLYDLVSQASGGDDFERWFLHRSERYSRSSSRHLDRSIAYSDYDLEENGSWTYVTSLGGWGWRPRVAPGWRPYYNGEWIHSPSGALVWSSFEDWGWVPYHYGRWAYDPVYGWVWLPGAGYGPAWVYWMYGPDYVGWAPAGWYDCYRPYYNWCYRPYVHAPSFFGFGFYGRIRISEVDLRPWVFLNSGALVSVRVDKAAIATDLVRDRVVRGAGGFATVSSSPARFSRNDLKDPAAAVNQIVRRSVGSGTGKEGPGSPTDMTPFFRRDPELTGSMRERIVRTHAPDNAGVRSGGGSRGVIGSVAPISGGAVAPISGGSVAPITGDNRFSGGRGGAGSVNRGIVPSVTPGNAVAGGGSNNAGNSNGGLIDRGGRDWRNSPAAGGGAAGGSVVPRDGGSAPTGRDRIARPSGGDTSSTNPGAHNDAWRGRGSAGDGSTPDRGSSPRGGDRQHGSDVPRRVIDGIGGARVYPDAGRSRDTAPRSNTPPPQRPSSPPPQQPPPQQHSSPPPAPSHSEDSHPSNSGNGGGEKHHR